MRGRCYWMRYIVFSAALDRKNKRWQHPCGLIRHTFSVGVERIRRNVSKATLKKASYQHIESQQRGGYFADHIFHWISMKVLLYFDANGNDVCSYGISSNKLALVWVVAWCRVDHYPNPCLINRLRPRQNGRHFADDIFKCIFLNGNVWIPIKNTMKFFS